MNGDASAVEKLNIDLLGNITNWPQDFFGNAMEDAVAMVEAAVERKPGSPA
jgi:predicted ATPase